MREKSIGTKLAICLLVAVLGVTLSTYAQRASDLSTTPLQGAGWSVHDEKRLLPPVITPAELTFGGPPSDAIILFDGEDTYQWESDKGGQVPWKVENGYMEVVKEKGGIHTNKSFGSCQLHIEWATPEKADPNETGQKRGNSGIFFMGKYELQVLDSYTENNYADNRTYADGQAASMYGQYPPMVNACRKPGRWQSYDVSFLRPIFGKDGKCIRPARITVMHNGVVVHNNVEIQGSTAHKRKAKYSPHPDRLPLGLQEHGNPIRFRNIWLRELPEQPYLITE